MPKSKNRSGNKSSQKKKSSSKNEGMTQRENQSGFNNREIGIRGRGERNEE